MGTRGIYGFYTKSRKFRLVYKQYDSYPSALGVTLANELNNIVHSGNINAWE
jgi:hypothetical protein